MFGSEFRCHRHQHHWIGFLCRPKGIFTIEKDASAAEFTFKLDDNGKWCKLTGNGMACDESAVTTARVGSFWAGSRWTGRRPFEELQGLDFLPDRDSRSA